MNVFRTTFALAIAVTLAGCMVSEEPLIGSDDADFPFKAISYRQTGDNDATQDAIELVRDGDSYVTVGTDEDAGTRLRLEDVGDGLYLAQVSSEKDGKATYVYSVLKVDFSTDTAESYLAAAKDAFVIPGISQCADGNLCIDDLDAYLALARAEIADGAKPDATYAFVTMN